ncbi:hypothetical protein OCU_15030 [Mycobacterium intracellulare ATCC 13950]|nr:hypothetical protein OCU_15030 [Mycobacterium intracellulare ATCC 13950]
MGWMKPPASPSATASVSRLMNIENIRGGSIKPPTPPSRPRLGDRH